MKLALVLDVQRRVALATQVTVEDLDLARERVGHAHTVAVIPLVALVARDHEALGVRALAHAVGGRRGRRRRCTTTSTAA